MADARLIHKTMGQSAKIAALSDFEFRVWVQYQLSANDFGVMPAESSTLQSDNRVLRTRPHRKVQAALENVIGVGLLWTFLHQEQRYVWQWDWNDYQGVRWPRATIHPAPPAAELSRASVLTQKLFADHFARARKESGRLAEPLRQSSAENDPLACARNARSSSSTGSEGFDLDLQEETKVNEREAAECAFEQFWHAYPRKVGKADARRKFMAAGAALLHPMLKALEWQRNLPNWTKDGGKFIPHPATWLHQHRWDDEPFNLPDATQQAWERMARGEPEMKS